MQVEQGSFGDRLKYAPDKRCHSLGCHILDCYIHHNYCHNGDHHYHDHVHNRAHSHILEILTPLRCMVNKHGEDV